MSIDVNALRAHLDEVGQSHLLAFWGELDERSQLQLADQLRGIDFAALHRALNDQQESQDWGQLASQSTSPPAVRLDDSGNLVPDAAALAAGEQALRDGRVGVILVAGGQGSRLGFEHPKGMYPIGPVSNRTLFEMHIDRLLGMQRRYGKRIPLYLMTSPATHDETVAFFAENRFGLDEDQLTIFCQGTMPAVDAQNGRLLLEAKDRVFLSPDGHGGTLAALDKSGSLDQMQQDDIEHLFYFQVDNPLVDIADPLFLGHHLVADSELTSQVVAKQDPREKVGVVVSLGDRLQIIEYSDLPEEQACQRNSDGSLCCWAGSIAVHVFERSFLQRMADSSNGLPWHLARKKVAYLNDSGNLIEPQQPNAIKLERFIFDLLPAARNALVVEVNERDAFAPLKNATGAPKDTAETCRAAIVHRHRRWLEAAGADVAPNVSVEIAAQFALDSAELQSKLDPNLVVTEDTFFDN